MIEIHIINTDYFNIHDIKIYILFLITSFLVVDLSASIALFVETDHVVRLVDSCS